MNLNIINDAPIMKASVALVESAGTIPDELAKQTMLILNVHRQNGDLGWVKDMILELENVAKSHEFRNMK